MKTLAPELADILKAAIGVGVRRPGGTIGRNPWQNRSHHHVNNPATAAPHEALVALGFMARDPACDYGSIRVYRVTKEGAEAVGRKLPARLASLVPPQPEPLSKAA